MCDARGRDAGVQSQTTPGRKEGGERGRRSAVANKKTAVAAAAAAASTVHAPEDTVVRRHKGEKAERGGHQARQKDPLHPIRRLERDGHVERCNHHSPTADSVLSGAGGQEGGSVTN